MRTYLHVVPALAVFALLACNGPSPNQQTAASSAPANVACESPAQAIAIGAEVSGEITATAEPYPANARYYCFAVGEGAPSVTLRLSGLTADLDLYVGSVSLRSVQGVDISRGQTYQWKSNDFGAGDEQVVIQSPAAGVYYAEIVSYEGAGSPYTFSVR